MNAEKRGSGNARSKRAVPRGKLAKLVRRTGVIVGDPGRLAAVKTFDESKWRKKWSRRTK